MYLNYFDLKKEPFNITPDPELLFLSPSHKEALAAAIYGVTQRKGFIAIVGEVGVGKTTIVRSFLEKMSGQDLKVIYLFNADISFHGLLRTIYDNLGITPESDDSFEMVSHLHHILIELYRRGTNVVLIIDEAQNLPVETLKSLHMLSNLETATVKLIQVVLSGQPELEEKLGNDLLRQIRQRVVIKVRILPLSKKDSLAYIAHRLMRTARTNPDLFSAGALKVIVNAAGGVPRVINTLCDNCLITAYGRQQERVSAKIAGEAVLDVVGKTSLGSYPASWRHALTGAGVALAFSVLVFALTQIRTAPKTEVVPVPAPRVIPEMLPPQPPKEAAVKARLLEEPTAGRQEPQQPVPQQGLQPQPAQQPQQTQQGQHPQQVQHHAKDGGSRVVKRGDTLARLIVQRYGFVNRRLISLVKRSNPQIIDENLIQEGSVVKFPTLAEGS